MTARSDPPAHGPSQSSDPERARDRSSLLAAWQAGAGTARAGGSAGLCPFQPPWTQARGRLLALWWIRGWNHGAEMLGRAELTRPEPAPAYEPLC